jgi:drug/metabolite transporter (DMT)-like permease
MEEMMNRIVYFALILVSTALMGSSFAVGKITLEYISPLLLVGLRFTLAGALMAIITVKRRRPDNLADWGRIVIVGFFQTTTVMGSIFLSMRTVSASESSILTFSNPLFVVLFGTIFLSMRYRLLQWIGVVAGFFGVYIALGMKMHLQSGTWIGLVGAVSWAVATLMVNRWRERFDVWVLTAYQMLSGGTIMLVLSFALEKPKLEMNLTSVSTLLWLAVMGSIIQFAFWFYLLQHGDPAKTSAFLFLAPFFGILSGWLILGEAIEKTVIFGSLLIFVGIFLINWPKSKVKEIRDDASARSYHWQ